MVWQELIRDDGLRIDGRRAEEIRRVNARLGVVEGADGSAYLEQGHTRILAAVYGPLEDSSPSTSTSSTPVGMSTAHATDALCKAGWIVPPCTAGGRVHCEYSVASFASPPASVRAFQAYRRRRGRRLSNSRLDHDPIDPDNAQMTKLPFHGTATSSKFRQRSRDAAVKIRDVFEAVILSGGDPSSGGSSPWMPPHARVNLFVQVLQSDGGELAAAINCVGLAVAHAGIPMRDMVVACTTVAIPLLPFGSSASSPFCPVVDASALELRQASLVGGRGGSVPEAIVVVLGGASFHGITKDWLKEEKDVDKLRKRARLLSFEFRNSMLSATDNNDSGTLFDQLMLLAATTGCAQVYQTLHDIVTKEMEQVISRRDWSCSALTLARSS